VMDRLNQHTLQCKACSAALKWVQQLQVRVGWLLGGSIFEF
jgi:hypothetical protein